jgi:hypothetical protein
MEQFLIIFTIIRTKQMFDVRAKVEISLKKKAGNYADIIITPTKGSTKRFSGYVIPTAKSDYFKRSSII